MDEYQIELMGLRFFGRHGAFQEEQVLGQEFHIDVYLDVYTSDLQADQVKGVVNYGDLALRIKAVFDSKPFALIESLANAILLDLSAFKGIKRAKIRIKKPSAPIPLIYDYVAVVVCREYTDAS